MASLSLERLPYVVQDIICSYLQRDDLISLGFTCRDLAYASRCRLFSSIRFPVSASLLHDEAHMSSIRALVDSDLARHVRSITLYEGSPEQEWTRRIEDREAGTDNLPKYTVFDDESGLLSPTFARYEPPPAPTGDQKARLNDLWRPLMDIIVNRIPGLTDVVYSCFPQIPTSLLEALRTRPGRLVRLHIPAGNFTSGCLPNGHTWAPMDSEEVHLATSPCLHSIAFHVHEATDEGFVSHTKDILFHMMAETAPNLESVTIRHYFPHDVHTLTLLNTIYRDYGYNPTWRGFDGKGVARTDPSRKGTSLRNLACSISHLKEVHEVADLSRLRSLSLDLVDTNGLCDLLQLVHHHGDFPALSWLRLEWTGSYTVDPMSRFPVASFLSRLPPLRTLFLEGQVSHDSFFDLTLPSLLERHGPSLVQLAIREPITTQQIETLRLGCPGLRQLEVCVPRSQGDAVEVSAYRELARFERLESICVRLRCVASTPRPEDLWQANCWSHVPVESMREWLINSAVDERLARSIFRVLDSRGDGRLKRMAVRAENATSVSQRGIPVPIWDALQWVARNWRWERRHPGTLPTVREIAHDVKRTRTGEEPWSRSTGGEHLRTDNFDDYHFGHGVPRPDKFRTAWTSLWPGDGPDRREDWFSFPLHDF